MIWPDYTKWMYFSVHPLTDLIPHVSDHQLSLSILVDHDIF
jgi:hypothetical protein